MSGRPGKRRRKPGGKPKRAGGSPAAAKTPARARPGADGIVRKRSGARDGAGRGAAARASGPSQAGPARAWWVPWLAGAGALLWLAVLWNAAIPMLRCTSVWANKLLFLAVMLLPWYWLRLWRRIPDPRWRVAVGLLAVAGGLAGPLLAWRSGSWTTTRKDISAVDLPAGGRVVAREERSPGSLRYRMVARHERELMPGVLLVRNLATCPDAKGGLVEMLDPDTVRIRPARVLGDVPAFVCELKDWVWWNEKEPQR